MSTNLEDALLTIRETSISQIIGLYYAISKKGSNYEAICPFHSDTKPSLKINDQKQIYKCFVCGAGGDAIRFVMDYENLDFKEAVKNIGDRLGLTVEINQRPVNPKLDMARRVLRLANRLYHKFAHDLQSSEYQNFLHKRQITQEVAQDFQMGLAPKNNVLTNYLQKLEDKKQKDSAINIAKEIGIIKMSKSGQLYDFFRGRITFPVWNHTGAVSGFCARALTNDQMPKYLNSGESLVFDKKNILYAFNLAKKNIRDKNRAILCEGHMDVVALHQYGFNYSVGTQGVALSVNCAKSLIGLTSEIYVGMDNDNAGLEAAKRINSIFLSQNTLAYFLDFSPEKDPDDFLKVHGRLELEERIENAPGLLDYLIDKELEKLPKNTVDQKLSTLNVIFELLAPLGESLQAKEKAVDIAKSLSLNSSPEDIISEYINYLKRQNTKIPTGRVNESDLASDKQASNSHFVDNNSARPPYYANLTEKETHQSGEDNALSQVLTSEFHKTLKNDGPVSKTELLILEQFLTYPEFVLAKESTEVLDLIDHFEVKRLISWLSKTYLEVEESDYKFILESKIKQTHKIDLKNTISKSVKNHVTIKLDAEIVKKSLKDFQKRLKIQKLKKQKEQCILEQSLITSEKEGLIILQRILEIEKKLREL